MSVLTLESTQTTNLRAVGIIDDNHDSAEEIRILLADLDVGGVVLELSARHTLDEAVELVRSRAEALICDAQLHPLLPGAQFNGAQLVARLVRLHHFPCVLITSFTLDVGMLVRPHRRWIPVLLGRDQTEDPQTLLDGLERCREEILRGPTAERRTHRVTLLIEKAAQIDAEVALDARVGGWHSRTPMRFPASMLPGAHGIESARGLVGKVLFARVNIGAVDESELYLEDPEREVVDPTGLPLHFEEGIE